MSRTSYVAALAVMAWALPLCAARADHGSSACCDPCAKPNLLQRLFASRHAACDERCAPAPCDPCAKPSLRERFFGHSRRCDDGCRQECDPCGRKGLLDGLFNRARRCDNCGGERIILHNPEKSEGAK